MLAESPDPLYLGPHEIPPYAQQKAVELVEFPGQH